MNTYTGLFYSYKRIYQSEQLVKKYIYYHIKKRFLTYMARPRDVADKIDLMNLICYYQSHLDKHSSRLEGEIANTMYKMVEYLKQDRRGIPAWLKVDFKRLDLLLEKIS